MSPRAKSLAIPAAVSALFAANVAVAVHTTGTAAGQTYRWLDRDTGAVLVYSPSVFGSAHFELKPRTNRSAGHWELLSPERPSPWLPWNWLAVTLTAQPPDPDTVVRMIAGRWRDKR
jgi:hypothetical protein